MWIRAAALSLVVAGVVGGPAGAVEPGPTGAPGGLGDTAFVAPPVAPPPPDDEPADVAAPPPRVGAKAGMLVDERTGRVLWKRNPAARRPVGSITKVMTAVVVLRSGRLDRRIRITSAHLRYARARNGSTARLRAGDRIPVRHLLGALLVPSGCDAAAALADAYGPGRTRFVAKMNRTARRLGMTRTVYNDPAGLGSNPGVSTARDQVALGRHAMRRPEFRRVVGSERYAVPRTRTHRAYTWHTTNRLMGDQPGLTGIKSGYTRSAGYSFLFAATRRGRTLTGVVLDSSRTSNTARFRDARTLLNHPWPG